MSAHASLAFFFGGALTQAPAELEPRAWLRRLDRGRWRAPQLRSLPTRRTTSRGTVSFTDDVNMVLDIDNLVVDGIAIGSVDNKYTSTSQAVGSISSGDLVLNITHQAPGVTSHITLNVTPQ